MIVKVKFQKFTNLIFKPLDVFLKILIVVVSIWTPIDLAAYILENIQQGLLISFSSLIMIFIFSRILITFSNIDLPNAKTLQIEALCQNFPIVLGYFTCARNAGSSNLWNDLLLNKHGFCSIVFFFKKVLKIIFLIKICI